MTELKLEFELENAELPIDYDKAVSYTHLTLPTT